MRSVNAALLAFGLALAPLGAQAEGPVVPCPGATAEPAPSAVGAPPAIAIWYGGDLSGWQPGACIGWEAAPAYNVLVAAAGRFPEAGGTDAILGRFAPVSHYPGISYWSVMHTAWRPLITEAYALSTANPKSKRADFTVAELVPGNELFFFQNEETPAGALVYRLEVRERGPDRLLVTLTNAAKVRWMFVPLFDPGQYQFVYLFERDAPGSDVWRYYSLTRVGGPWNPVVRIGTNSYINRAAALFRYLGGLPLQQEPPAAP